jgi:hypothetical protein
MQSVPQLIPAGVLVTVPAPVTPTVRRRGIGTVGAEVKVVSMLDAVLPEASALLTRKWYVVLADKPDKGTP